MGTRWTLCFWFCIEFLLTPLLIWNVIVQCNGAIKRMGECIKTVFVCLFFTDILEKFFFLRSFRFFAQAPSCMFSTFRNSGIWSDQCVLQDESCCFCLNTMHWPILSYCVEWKQKLKRFGLLCLLMLFSR